MAKKSKKVSKVTKWMPIAAAVLGVVSLVMIFVVAIMKDNAILDDTLYTGWQVTFGYSTTTDIGASTIVTTWLSFSFMNLLPYLLVIAAIVACVLSFLGNGNKLFALIAAACFIVAGGFFFLVLSFSLDSKGEVLQGYVLGAGPIVSGICSIVAALVSVTPFVFDKLGK